jgi:hypothetical protein
MLIRYAAMHSPCDPAAAVPGGLDLLGSCPGDAVIARLGEVDVGILSPAAWLLTKLITMWLVAPLPVGAPLAMSTLGAGARSLRAPATPSIVGRPWGVDDPRLIHGADDRRLGRPGPATIAGHRHQLKGLLAGRLHRSDAEDVGVAQAVGADGAAVGGLRWPLLAAAEI